jgi:hypothetical protein
MAKEPVRVIQKVSSTKQAVTQRMLRTVHQVKKDIEIHTRTKNNAAPINDKPKPTMKDGMRLQKEAHTVNVDPPRTVGTAQSSQNKSSMILPAEPAVIVAPDTTWVSPTNPEDVVVIINIIGKIFVVVAHKDQLDNGNMVECWAIRYDKFKELYQIKP